MKIKNVTINKYKSFNRDEIFNIEGKNVFIYGENGSGKSSLYYALKDFFQSSVENIDMSQLRNFNLDDGNTDCSIKVRFDNDIDYSINEQSKNTNVAVIIDANRLKSFLTYKHLIKVHDVKLSNEIDLFDLIVGGVLKHFKSAAITSGIELGKLWEDVEKESNKSYGSGQEFYQAKQKCRSVDNKIRLFNSAINKLFLSGNLDYLAPRINEILDKFGFGIHVEFNRILPQRDAEGYLSVRCRLLLQITNMQGKAIPKAHFLLNEAKLSAIAISVFLASIKKQEVFSPNLKPLFLDDVLVGLDSENRLKLLKLLSDPNGLFSEFQIFITTYDRHWYEVAKLYLQGWHFMEFYKGQNGEPQIINNNKTNLERAKAYFEAYDFPACANYLRKECENVLKDKLLETYSVSDEGLKGLVKMPSLENLINRLKFYYKDLEVIPPEELIQALQTYRTISFNPMSHNDVSCPIYKTDLENAFNCIDELDNLKLPQRELLIPKGQIFTLRINILAYVAFLRLAENVYKISHHSGEKHITSFKFYYIKWERLGIEFAEPKGINPIAISNIERLDQIKAKPFSCENITFGLNQTCQNILIPELVVDDIRNNLTFNGTTLADIILQNS